INTFYPSEGWPTVNTLCTYSWQKVLDILPRQYAGKKAKPESDYVERHIKGAASLPFYLVESYLDAVPRDVWIVVYCACPHAESEAAADVLLDAGFDKVRVLDEGFRVWQERGYPTESGA
ncbi:MAG: rhodanese-like domain-containing protein, partial [Nannocystaceae bacterium]